jgi:hypothetical protein
VRLLVIDGWSFSGLADFVDAFAVEFVFGRTIGASLNKDYDESGATFTTELIVFRIFGLADTDDTP